MKTHKDLSIFITIGSGQDLGITHDNHLVLIDYTGHCVVLGLATKDRFKTLKDYLQRLEIHAIEEDIAL